MMDDSPRKNGDGEARFHEPPAAWIPACGVLCDMFWWARRDVPAPGADLPAHRDAQAGDGGDHQPVPSAPER
jgi:hypothetical protein